MCMKGMSKALHNMPISRQKLTETHTLCREHAVKETFRKTYLFEDTQKYAKKLEVNWTIR